MFFELNDLRMFYKVEGEGLPLLMLHGWPTDHEALVGAFEPIFAKRPSFSRVYVDLPGMGRTTGGSWIDGNDAVVEVLVQFVAEVIGERPFLTVGFSYGGYLARGLLQRLPEQMAGMMLLVPVTAVRPERTLPSPIYFNRNPALFERYPAPFGEMFASIVVVHEEAIAARQAEVLGGLQKADQAMLAQISQNSKFAADVDALPAPYDKPVLILTGKHDIQTGYADPYELVQLYPRATYAVLDRAGHGLHMEQPALFNLFVNEWLDRVMEVLAGEVVGSKSVV